MADGAGPLGWLSGAPAAGRLGGVGWLEICWKKEGIMEKNIYCVYKYIYSIYIVYTYIYIVYTYIYIYNIYIYISSGAYCSMLVPALS